MVQSMFIHGYTPNGLLESVLISIPKDARGDLCSSDNYRGIALCSALCKVIDIIVIERYREKLLTSELQFAFKALHSTSMCTTVVKEVCNYYRARSTNVYICMLDASKAFDRVHYGKLFNLLRQRNLPPTITRLLLDMYTRQRLYASWNGEISDPFQTQMEWNKAVFCHLFSFVFILMNCCGALIAQAWVATLAIFHTLGSVMPTMWDCWLRPSKHFKN